MKIIDDLLKTLPEGRVKDVRVGSFWTAVVVEVEGRLRCGLATSMRDDDHHHHTGKASVPEAGRLTSFSTGQLAALAGSDSQLEASIGVATINALLPPHPDEWVDVNAEAVVAERAAGKSIVVVGHFPFVSRWEEIADRLWVLEKRPRGSDLPAEAAQEVIPQADIVAISGTTLINHTFDELVNLCRPDTMILMLGPSTPLSPVLYDYGVNFLSGSFVEAVEPVLQSVSQGANFRQVHRAGVRLVTMHRRL